MTCERCRGFAYRNEDGDEECLHCGHVKDSTPPLAPYPDGYHRRDFDPEVIVEHHKATARRYMRRRYVSRQATGA